ncbi:MAG: glycogen synthase GlgA [Candidatus Accumulibacter sp.]|jgi:starch synthase|nr:glycogen synthase GlgA [Accumulibacter sp.]
MHILHVAAEIYPLVKTGGLADIVAALPNAQAKRGCDVRVLLPGFRGILAGVTELTPVAQIGPVFGAAAVQLLAGRLPDTELSAYVIDAPFLYDREGNPYVGPDRHDWKDNHRRFALLGWAAAHIAFGELDPDWQPDIVHAHDWHAGLASAYIRQNPSLKTPTVFTVHNLAFRGIFPMECYGELGLTAQFLTPSGLEFYGSFSFMKAGLVYSDKITTVSPTYAKEIQTPEFGWGLDGVLTERANDLSGILNGVDYDVWTPQDPKIARTYTATNQNGKKLCKRALQKDFGLQRDGESPLFAVVSRLAGQKGMDLLLDALPELIGGGGQLVVLGTGETEIEARFFQASQAYPGRVAVRIGYDENLSHRIMAGADLLLVPSRFEPCGLTQLYALRYGTLPVVHRVGGLSDTVVDTTPETIASGRATGFSFDRPESAALGARIRDACTLYHKDRGLWRRIRRRAMLQNFSWDDSAAHYEVLYRNLL